MNDFSRSHHRSKLWIVLLSDLENLYQVCGQRRLMFKATRETGEELCCVMADIDHFKAVNDNFGHGAGDIVIQKMAQALQAAFREEDIVCRYGGEEFCILLPGISMADAAVIANRVRETITALIYNEVNEVLGRNITASFGVSSSYLGADDEQSLVERADMALYSSKETGRNKVTR
jgi:diguanylate cyclase (GGDEF)-like protein